MNARTLKRLSSPWLLLPGVALAHAGHGEAPAWASGLLHPLSGIDHLLSMVGVGIWASASPAGRRWAVPAAALLALVLGVAWGAAGSTLPGLEGLLAATLLLMGGLLTAAPGVRLLLAGPAVVAMAGLHGFAHGAEMLPGTAFGNYVLGLAVASLALQLSGMGLGRVVRRHFGERARLLGLPFFATGSWLMLGAA